MQLRLDRKHFYLLDFPIQTIFRSNSISNNKGKGGGDQRTRLTVPNETLICDRSSCNKGFSVQLELL